MKLLFLTSDWKWTGPAEPMLDAARALAGRGHEVALACPEAPSGAERGVAREARARGIEPAIALARARGVRPAADARDARALALLVRERRFDVVHVWHTRAHALALRARVRAAGAALVRAHASGVAPGVLAPERFLLERACDALVCPSRACEAAHTRRANAHALLGCVDLARFAPRDAAARAALRSELGLAREAPLVGVVARIQPHRRFDLVLDVAARLRERAPGARLAIVGRGTHAERLVDRPVAERGLGDVVVRLGYREHDYAAVLAAFDALLYLVPGSDGGCRSVLEAQACGVPVVASRRGALPELLVDGETGACVDEDADALASVLARFALDDSGKARAAARAHAERAFHPERVARELEAIHASARARLR